ncbi:MAG TPA: diguanylate cyclase [Candidatus Binatia bacterium]|nr:diguanylate cyclase [Candidatus Binatia bacterium]
MTPPADPVRDVERLRREVARLRVAEEAQRALIDGVNCIVLRWDPIGRVTFLNAWGQQFFGWPLDELRGHSVVGTIVPETETSGRDLAALITDVLTHPKRHLSNENENIRRNGDRVWVTWRNHPVVDGEGRLREILSTGIDTTERKRAEDALRESERRYRVVFQSLPVALIERDASTLRAHLDALRARGIGDLRTYLREHPDEVRHSLSLIRTTDRNTALLALFEADEPGQEPALNEAEAAMLAPAAPEILEAVAEGWIVSREREQTVHTLRGNTRRVVMRGTVVPGHEDTLSRVIITLVDITARKAAEEALRASAETFRQQSLHDTLTGLYNTRHLYEALAQLLRDTAQPCSVIFFDLDRFKTLVDTHGHLLGSEIIQEVASRLRGIVHEPAFGVAYAGDEFVVVLPGADKRAAHGMATTLRERIGTGAYLATHGLDVRVSASFGVATFPDDADDVRTLLGCADRVLFAVKRDGRGGVRAWPV